MSRDFLHGALERDKKDGVRRLTHHQALNLPTVDVLPLWSIGIQFGGKNCHWDEASLWRVSEIFVLFMVFKVFCSFNK